jgi:hypothetical protein
MQLIREIRPHGSRIASFDCPQICILCKMEIDEEKTRPSRLFAYLITAPAESFKTFSINFGSDQKLFGPQLGVRR